VKYDQYTTSNGFHILDCSTPYTLRAPMQWCLALVSTAINLTVYPTHHSLSPDPYMYQCSPLSLNPSTCPVPSPPPFYFSGISTTNNAGVSATTAKKVRTYVHVRAIVRSPQYLQGVFLDGVLSPFWPVKCALTLRK
jgi:hypothetical protein